MRAPSISTSTVEWPSHVARSPDAGGCAKSAVVSDTIGIGPGGTRCSCPPSQCRIIFHVLPVRADAGRLRIPERAVAIVGRSLDPREPFACRR